jgi:hypothetical protein
MSNKRHLSVLGSIAFCLTLSSACAMVFLGWLATAMPPSAAVKLSDHLVRFIGHSGQVWFLFALAVFIPPVGATVAVLACSRFRGVLLRISGIASVAAMIVSYWPWRKDNLADVFLVLLSGLMIAMTLMYARGQFGGRLWMGVMMLLGYYGLFAWIFNKVVFVPEVNLVPAFGLISSLVWARDVTAASS